LQQVLFSFRQVLQFHPSPAQAEAGSCRFPTVRTGVLKIGMKRNVCCLFAEIAAVTAAQRRS
jgi:hypothetical protein